MIQDIQATHGGVEFPRTTMADSRRRTRRMRLFAILVTVAVGFSGGLLQQFHRQANLNASMGEAFSPIPTGPFAALPRL
jgi:hypothetical protein